MLGKNLIQAAAGNAAGEGLGIEDVFSTWLYTGNGSTQTITNGIDLAGEGGMVWIKWRNGSNYTSRPHYLFDSVRGLPLSLSTNSTGANIDLSNSLTTFNVDGFSFGGGNAGSVNWSGETYASWTFRKAEKFFDVVTYTGTGSNRTIAHNLGSVPGCIIVKKLDSTGGDESWAVYHRSTTATNELRLNSTLAAFASSTAWNDTEPTSSVFTVGTGSRVNLSGSTYVAYLFAHDAGGFGEDGTESVIKCGSFTTDGSGNATVDLGWEPQWVLFKSSSNTQTWAVADSMRGMTTSSNAHLYPNTADAEFNNAGFYLAPTATGFTAKASVSYTYIYIAIRRGPMKTPASGTDVFGLVARTGTGADATVIGGQIADLAIIKNTGAIAASVWAARATGVQYLTSTSTAAEVTAGTTILQENPWDVMDGIKIGTTSSLTNASSNTFINYLFSRAPGFFDTVCYTGTGVARTVAHNLRAVPELLIIKSRTTTDFWPVYYGDSTKSLSLNTLSLPSSGVTRWNSTSPTSSVFSVGADVEVNSSGLTYIAHMFATLAGISKIGTYVGTGAALQVDCGFTAGARFVLIKRISVDTGGWIVHDTARGITTSNDPYFFLNSTSAQTTTNDWIDPYSAGFELSNDASSTINVNGSSYLFLAIA